MNLAKALMISIQLLKKENTDEALLFLQPYESECVNLASEILRGGADCWALYYSEPSQAGNVSRDQDAGGQKIAGSSPAMTDDAMSFPRSDAGIFQGQKLAGLFALRKKRSLFFCLPFAKYKSAFDKKVCSEAQRPLMEFFESREPFCVNGEAAGAIFLRNILKNKKSPMRPSVTNKYFLMVSGEENESCPQALERRISRNVRARDQASANSGIESLSRDSGEENQEASQNKKAVQAQNSGGGSGAAGGLRVIQATAADYERLLPLELGYQREEVVPKSFDISDAALGAAFKHELGQGLTFALYDGGRPIAKARVSACGLRHCMLGGVYTIPSERKKGRASFLVRQIIARQSLAFNGFCLYAKQENAAALALYKSLGFEARGEYLLVYY